MKNQFKQTPPEDWLLNLNSHLTSTDFLGEYGEDSVLDFLFTYIDDCYKFGIDIGAGGGLNGSNIRKLADKYDWNTIELEGSQWPNTHSRVESNIFVFKENIVNLLKARTDSKNFDFLTLDIDSMDHYILEEILQNDYKFNCIILEYNPIFTKNQSYRRKFDNGYRKDSTSGYGASLKAFEILLSKFSYTLVHNFAEPSKGIFSNNAIFLNNSIVGNFTTEVEDVIYKQPWIEPWKNRKNKKVVLDPLEIKNVLHTLENIFDKYE